MLPVNEKAEITPMITAAATIIPITKDFFTDKPTSPSPINL